MVELCGDTALCGVLVRTLLARGMEVSCAPLDPDRRPQEPDPIFVVAEGLRDERSSLTDLPSFGSARIVLVVAEVVATSVVGSGAVLDVTSHAGPRDWAAALAEAGARAFVVPRWVATLASVFGIHRLDVVGRDVQLVTGMRVPSVLPAQTSQVAGRERKEERDALGMQRVW